MIGLTDEEIAQSSQDLFLLQREFSGSSDALVDTYHEYQQAARAYRRAKANALLRAPINDPKDPSGKRKYTADDRNAWVEVETDVVAAADAMLVAEIAHKYHAEEVWARKNRLEALKILRADIRAEMNL